MTSVHSPGGLALVAGGASGLLAISRELGADDRVVAVVQYLRVALITASMPVVVTLVYHVTKTNPSLVSIGNHTLCLARVCWGQWR